MPVNKAARVRHEIIDECLRTVNKKWTKQLLLARVNERLSLHYGEEKQISLSQLRYDLEAMQAEYGAPIETKREGKLVYYWYEDHGFSILKTPVTEDDVLHLKLAINLLRQLKGFTISTEIGEIVQKLERKIQFADENPFPNIEFEAPTIVKGLEYLEDFYHAIIQKNVLKLHYQPFNQQTPQEWIIHPYLLKQYKNRWYLIGLYEDSQTIGIYALDRIRKVTVCNHPFIENLTFDPQAFFRDIIGITMPFQQHKENVVLKITPSRAPYVLTKPLHPSQHLLSTHNDGSITIGLTVMINFELIGTLLSFGPDVQVLQPSVLVGQVKIQLQNTLLLYSR